MLRKSANGVRPNMARTWILHHARVTHFLTRLWFSRDLLAVVVFHTNALVVLVLKMQKRNFEHRVAIEVRVKPGDSAIETYGK